MKEFIGYTIINGLPLENFKLPNGRLCSVCNLTGEHSPYREILEAESEALMLRSKRFRSEL